MPASPASPPTPTTAATQLSTAAGCFHRAHGALLLLGAIGVGVLGWLVLNILSGNLRKAPDQAEEISAFALWMISHRSLLPLATLPAAAAGLWMMAHRGKSGGKSVSRHAMPWIVTTLATLWLVAIFGVILITFVMFLAPLYQYHDIG